MPAGYLSNPLVFLVDTLVGAYIFILILRLLLQYTAADSRNPISAFIIKVTQPPLTLLKPLFPTIKGVNLAAIVLIIMLRMLIGVVISFAQGDFSIWAIFVWSIAELVDSVLSIFLFSIFATVIISWINPNSYHPAVSLVYKITEPVMQPIQRVIPPIGGMDLTPMIALIGLQVLKMLLIPPILALSSVF